jgi:hypothetical protein
LLVWTAGACTMDIYDALSGLTREEFCGAPSARRLVLQGGTILFRRIAGERRFVVPAGANSDQRHRSKALKHPDVAVISQSLIGQMLAVRGGQSLLHLFHMNAGPAQ